MLLLILGKLGVNTDNAQVLLLQLQYGLGITVEWNGNLHANCYYNSKQNGIP